MLVPFDSKQDIASDEIVSFSIDHAQASHRNPISVPEPTFHRISGFQYLSNRCETSFTSCTCKIGLTSPTCYKLTIP